MFLSFVCIYIVVEDPVTSHLNSTELLNTKRQRRVTLEIQVPAWDRHTNMAGLNQLTGSSTTIYIQTNDKNMNTRH
jgi:hypothetical protein